MYAWHMIEIYKITGSTNMILEGAVGATILDWEHLLANGLVQDRVVASLEVSLHPLLHLIFGKAFVESEDGLHGSRHINHVDDLWSGWIGILPHDHGLHAK